MSNISFVKAINSALQISMEIDEKVICYGLGATDPKGIFGSTIGLAERFGNERVFDTPTSENAMTGIGIGAAIGIVAVMVRQELILFIMGGVFVIETLSVIVQVLSFKITGKRIFKMAPLHHHYELKGWAEPKVIVRFWIITVILVLIGLASLKIR